MPAQVLVITGPVGVGKTAVAFETMELLEERAIPHAFFDLDGLTYFYPKPASDPFGEQFALDALRLLMPRFEAQGVQRLVLARVLWEPDSVDLYRGAIPGAEITVVRLAAPPSVIETRIRRREAGSAAEWYIARARELGDYWAAHPIEDLLIQTNNKDVRSIAEEIVSRLGWE